MIKVLIDNIWFDSKFEASLYPNLKQQVKKGVLPALGLQVEKPMKIQNLDGESIVYGKYTFDYVFEINGITHHIEAKGYLHARDIYRVKVAKIVFDGAKSKFCMVWQKPKTKAQKKDNEYFYNLFKEN